MEERGGKNILCKQPLSQNKALLTFGSIVLVVVVSHAIVWTTICSANFLFCSFD